MLRITREDLLSEGNVIQLGIQPNRIDLLNFLTGVDTEAVWRNRIPGELDGVPLAYIDLESFKVNKLAAGRDKDMEDLRRLLKGAHCNDV